MDDYDVIIVGGGLVGASLACALAPTGLRCAVVEARTPPGTARGSYDEPTIALSYGSRMIFDGLGLWPAIADEAAPIRTIHVSERGRFGTVRMHSAEQGVEALGYTLPTRIVARALYERLRASESVSVISPAKLDGLEVEATRACVTLRERGSQRRLTTRLLVGADGIDSGVREQLRVPVARWDYGQSAIIANVTPARGHGHVAYERFTRDGPVAVLPLTGGRCTVVYTAGAHEADALVEGDEAVFAAALHARIGYRLGQLERVGKRRAYPLSLVHAREHVRPRAALIGNAAHTVHPVAAQGFNLGLRDVAALGESIGQALGRDGDPGGEAALSLYARWRAADHRRVIAFTDGLARVFGSDWPPVRWGRGQVLHTLALCSPLRRRFTDQAMGLSGPLPRLARGLPLAAKV